MNISRILKKTMVVSINTIYAPMLFGTLVLLAVFVGDSVSHLKEPWLDLVGLVLGCFSVIACLHVVGCASADRPVRLGESFAVGIVRIPGFLAAYLSVLILTTMGLMCLVVPGLYVMCRWGLAPFLVASDNIGVGEAFARSDELTRGRLWPVFVLAVSAIMVMLAAQYALVGLVYLAFETSVLSFFWIVLFMILAGLGIQWVFHVGLVVTARELSASSS
jgi:hypothetical protein